MFRLPNARLCLRKYPLRAIERTCRAFVRSAFIFLDEWNLVVKVLITEFKEERKTLDIDLSQEDANAFLDDPRGEVRSGARGIVGQIIIERVQDTFLVRGDVTLSMQYDCSRCTTEREMELQVPIEATLFPPNPSIEVGGEEVELSSDDLDISYHDGNEIDVSPIVREAIFLESPPYAHCGIEPQEDCSDYMRLIGAQIQSQEDEGDNIDPRWEGLRAIKARLESKPE